MEKPNEGRRAASEFGKEKAIVHDGVRYGTSIIPFSAHHLERVVELGDGSLVEGDVFGRKVEMGVEAAVTGRLYAQDWATVGMRSKVHGDVISHGSVVLEEATRVGDETASNIIAGDVRIGRKCIVTGNIIGRTSVELGDECIVRGASFDPLRQHAPRRNGGNTAVRAVPRVDHPIVGHPDMYAHEHPSCHRARHPFPAGFRQISDVLRIEERLHDLVGEGGRHRWHLPAWSPSCPYWRERLPATRAGSYRTNPVMPETKWPEVPYQVSVPAPLPHSSQV